ncbi:MAG: hypothetical protein AAGD05_05215 [Bacteroidota bacterium]
MIGNSLAMDGIDTEYLSEQGLSAYNLAIGGASIKTSGVQLSEYLAQAERKPKVVLLGLSSCIDQDFDHSGINPIVDFTRNNHAYSWRDIPMIRFRWLAIALLKKVVSPAHRDARVVAGQLKIKRRSVDRSNYSSKRPSIWSADSYRQSTMLNHVAQLCQSQDIPLIAIEMPGFKKTQNDIPLGPYSIDPAFQLYNFNNRHFCETFDAPTDWLGDNHLNEQGARRFTEHLFEALSLQQYGVSNSDNLHFPTK